MDVKIRKNQNILMISGKALIYFGIWSIVRILLYKILVQDYLNKILLDSGEYVLYNNSFDLVFDAAFLMLIIDLIVKIILGNAAVSEGKGNKRSLLFIILDILYAVSLITVLSYLLFGPYRDLLSMALISSVIIDMTTIIALIAIIVSSIQLRKLESEKEKLTKEAAYVS